MSDQINVESQIFFIIVDIDTFLWAKCFEREVCLFKIVNIFQHFLFYEELNCQDNTEITSALLSSVLTDSGCAFCSQFRTASCLEPGWDRRVCLLHIINCLSTLIGKFISSFTQEEGGRVCCQSDHSWNDNIKCLHFYSHVSDIL